LALASARRGQRRGARARLEAGPHLRCSSHRRRRARPRSGTTPIPARQSRRACLPSDAPRRAFGRRRRRGSRLRRAVGSSDGGARACGCGRAPHVAARGGSSRRCSQRAARGRRCRAALREVARQAYRPLRASGASPECLPHLMYTSGSVLGHRHAGCSHPSQRLSAASTLWRSRRPCVEPRARDDHGAFGEHPALGCFGSGPKLTRRLPRHVARETSEGGRQRHSWRCGPLARIVEHGRREQSMGISAQRSASTMGFGYGRHRRTCLRP
jgi:hypothetical protein